MSDPPPPPSGAVLCRGGGPGRGAGDRGVEGVGGAHRLNCHNTPPQPTLPTSYLPIYSSKDYSKFKSKVFLIKIKLKQIRLVIIITSYLGFVLLVWFRRILLEMFVIAALDSGFDQ